MPIPASEPSSRRDGESNKRARRSAGGGDLHLVRVKGEGADSRVPDADNFTACPEPDTAAVKTENMEAPCKLEPTKAAGALAKVHVVDVSEWCVAFKWA